MGVQIKTKGPYFKIRETQIKLKGVQIKIILCIDT